MSPARRRLLMRIWFALSLVLFAATCADRLRPYLQRITGSSKAGAEAPRSLRLATWNLQFLDVPGRGPDRRSRADLEALARYARTLAPDVLAVQEVASEEALAQVFPASTYAYHLAASGGAQRSGFVFKRALRVKRHPDLAALGEHGLRAGAELGVFFNGRELRLLSVHLKAFCVTGPLSKRSKDCAKLRAQVPVLESWIDARAREQVPLVVLGDFNRGLAAPNDELWRELDDGDPPGLGLLRAAVPMNARCHRPRQFAVDHVLLGGASRAWLAREGLRELPFDDTDRAQGVKLSDHCPLLVTLRAGGH